MLELDWQSEPDAVVVIDHLSERSSVRITVPLDPLLAALAADTGLVVSDTDDGVTTVCAWYGPDLTELASRPFSDLLRILADRHLGPDVDDAARRLAVLLDLMARNPEPYAVRTVRAPDD